MSKQFNNDNLTTYQNVDLENRPLITKTDVNGNILYANNTFKKTTGYTKEEIIGKPHSIVRHPDMPRELYKEMWSYIYNKKKWYGYLKNKTKDNKTYWVKAVIEPVFDDKGNIEGYMSYQKIIKNINIKKLYENLYKNKYRNKK